LLLFSPLVYKIMYCPCFSWKTDDRKSTDCRNWIRPECFP